MVDKTLILRKLAEVDQYLSQVKEYAGISIEQYESSWKTQRIIERTLQMMIETCVDIAGHIISDSAFRTPTSYADTRMSVDVLEFERAHETKQQEPSAQHPVPKERRKSAD